jgi:hypothetical protein
MHAHIEKVLSRRGVKDPGRLTADEAATVKSWEAMLSRPDLTVDGVADFCRERMRAVETRWADASVPSEERLRLVERHCTYRAILAAITAPAAEREHAERMLIDMAGG